MEAIAESVGKEVTTNMATWSAALATLLGATEDKIENLIVSAFKNKQTSDVLKYMIECQQGKHGKEAGSGGIAYEIDSEDKDLFVSMMKQDNIPLVSGVFTDTSLKSGKNMILIRSCDKERVDMIAKCVINIRNSFLGKDLGHVAIDDLANYVGRKGKLEQINGLSAEEAELFKREACRAGLIYHIEENKGEYSLSFGESQKEEAHKALASTVLALNGENRDEIVAGILKDKEYDDFVRNVLDKPGQDIDEPLVLYDANNKDNHIILLSGIDKTTGESQLEMEISHNGEVRTLVRNKQNPEEFDKKLLTAINGTVSLRPVLDKNGNAVLDSAGREKKVPHLEKGFSTKAAMSLEEWEDETLQKSKIKEAKSEKLKETIALSKEEKKRNEVYHEYLQKLEVKGHGTRKKLESGLLDAEVKLKTYIENEKENDNFDHQKALEGLKNADSRLSELEISINTPQATMAMLFNDAVDISNAHDAAEKDELNNDNRFDRTDSYDDGTPLHNTMDDDEEKSDDDR